MPFQKGQGGRPRGARNRVNQRVGVSLQELGGPEGAVYAEQLHRIATEPHGDIHARLKALALIVPYVWGKPVERHELAGAGGGPITFRWQD